jgi:hypothetical protein
LCVDTPCHGDYIPPAVRQRIRTTTHRAEGRLATALVAVLALIVCASAQASSVRVPADYYGINFQQLRRMKPADQDKHLAAIHALGIDQMRLSVAWARAEPTAPNGSTHNYKWNETDAEIAALARHGIRAQLNMTQTPLWDAKTDVWTNLACANTSSRAPVSITPYVSFAKAVASRYGRNGTFWAANPGLPAEPVDRYEIWNEPNLRGGWCPAPQPELYANMFAGAAAAIRAVDPQAEVVTGGVAPPRAEDPKYGLNVSTFFSRATARVPQLSSLATGVAVHLYPPADAGKQLERVAWFRGQLQAGGISNSTPMLVNEIGWATSGGSAPVSENDRAQAYATATVNIPRTNCNVLGMLPHTWSSAQQNPANPEDWFGIAGPATANPYASALAYSNGIKLMRGQLSVEAPTQALMACEGMPLPDYDGDGVPDPTDYYPTDPTRSAPPGSGGGGAVERDVVCAFGGDNVVGTRNGHDFTLSQDGADRLAGGGGRDTLKSNGGRDRLSGGTGGDRLVAGAGADRLVGEEGGDWLDGGGGNDEVDGGGGSDTAGGGDGDDHINGRGGEDRLGGGAGRDILIGGPGSNHLFGGPGADRLYASSSPADPASKSYVNGGPGRDRCSGRVGLDLFRNCERVIDTR